MNNKVKQNQLGFNTTDDTFLSIYKRLEKLPNAKSDADWLELRSKIYVRDRAMCWVCKEFVELKDYDLGHLVDRCMGGWDDYDNLAVMHTKCNLSKPKHKTLEECLRWQLTRHVTLKTLPKQTQPFDETKDEPKTKYTLTVEAPPITEVVYITPNNEDDKKAAKQLILEYFTTHPDLLIGKVNHARSAAIQQMANTFSISEFSVRKWLIEAKLVAPKIVHKDGRQYKYILEHLDELLAKYNSLVPHNPLQARRLMGLPNYQLEIMFYLAGMPEKMSNHNYHAIHTTVTRLNLPVRKPAEEANLTPRQKRSLLIRQSQK